MPSCFVLSLVLGAVGVAAQRAYDTPAPVPSYSTPPQLSAYGTPTEVPSTGTAYEYHGCAIVDLNGFDEPLYVENDKLTHETCQGVCEGKRIVAIFSDSCRCGDDPNAFKETDAIFCDNPCLGDPTQGMCGSTCDDTGDKISTIYITVEEAPEDPVGAEEVDPTVTPLVDPLPATSDSPPDPNAVSSDPPGEAEDVDPTSLPPPESDEQPEDPPEQPEDPLEQPEDVPETPEDPPEDPPAPGQPEDPSSSSVDTEPDTDPETESLEPDPVPEDPTETIPEDSQDTLEPTPSRVVVAEACLNQFHAWSMLGGLLLSLLVVG